MKHSLVFLIIFFMSFVIEAQNKTFLRVYDLTGKKIAKGFFTGATDSTIRLADGEQSFEIPVYKIGNIKTKRTVGHTILLVGGVSTVVWTAAFLSITGDDFFNITAGDAVASGLIAGTASGIVIGGIAGAAKNSKRIIVNGNTGTWLMVKPVFDKMPVYQRPVKE